MHHDKYKKVLADWNAKVVKALIKSATVPNMRVSVTGNYYGASSSTLHVTLDEVDLSAFGNQPQPVNNSKFEEEWKKVCELRNEIPRYYDNYGRGVPIDSIVYHYQKSLDMLDVLPAGTATITVKDFNFLTKF